MKKFLHIIPYNHLYPPANGGQLRCFHLMDELSKHSKIDVICYQPRKSFSERGYLNENITFYNSDSFDKGEGVLRLFPTKIRKSIRYRILTKTLFRPATLEVLEFSHVVKELAKQNKYKSVIFEHISAMNLVPVVESSFSNTKFILDAHNVDHRLIDKNIPANINRFNTIKKIESSLYEKVHEFWACSQHDVDILEDLNKHKINGIVVPNGVSIENKKYVVNKENTYNNILFCGTLDASPNKEGILWFYHNIWPLLKTNKPNLKLLVVGKGNREPFLELESDDSVNFIGEVKDVDPYYRESFIAIVPLLSGSGTRLKVLEAMSLGNPIVTTTKGIEGIEFENGEHALVADTIDDFYNNIITLVNKPEIGDQLRENAFKLVKDKYDWSVIVNNLLKVL